MRVLVTGCEGQVGADLCPALKNFDIIPLSHKDIEITDIQSIKAAINKYAPDIIINTAAYINVDDCEQNCDKAFSVNALGARNIAVVAQEINAKLVHISTDHIFGGQGCIASVPFCEFDQPSPVNVYGASKLAGEEYIKHLCNRYFIVRTAGLYGIAGSNMKGGNFVDKIIRSAGEKSELQVVDDQITSPTHTKDLANKMVELLGTEYYGTYHITNSGYCSWCQFARYILESANIQTPVIPVKSTEYLQKAKRPYFSALNNYQLKLLGMDDMQHWHDALIDYMKLKGYIH
jgi:dTDP-4-dehydrorhamnose reductase